jgi:hypothetical protein
VPQAVGLGALEGHDLLLAVLKVEPGPQGPALAHRHPRPVLDPLLAHWAAAPAEPPPMQLSARQLTAWQLTADAVPPGWAEWMTREQVGDRLCGLFVRSSLSHTCQPTGPTLDGSLSMTAASGSVVVGNPFDSELR